MKAVQFGRLWRGVNAAILLTAFFIALGGCTKPATTAIKAPQFRGTLTVMVSAGLAGYPGPAQPDVVWFQDQSRAYEAGHPGVKVELRVMPSPAELESAARTAGVGDTPDLLFGRSLADLGPRLADLTTVLDQTALQEYLPGALEGFRDGAAQRGLPMLLDTQVLALNEAAFKAAGVTLPNEGRWSQAEFADRLKKLSGAGHFGLSFYNLPGYHEWWPLLGAPIGSGPTVDNVSVEGLQRLAQFGADGWLHPDTGKLTAEATWSLFAANPPAFAVLPVGTWAIPLLRNPPFGVNVTIAGFPGETTLGYSYGVSVFAKQDADRVKAAANLAQFLTGPSNQIQLARLTGLMPAGARTNNPWDGDPAMTRAFQVRTGHRTLRTGPGWEDAAPAVARDLLYGLLGVRTPVESLQDAVAHITKATPPASK